MFLRAVDVFVYEHADVPLHGPYNVSVETAATTAKVTWSPGFDSGHPLHHVIW